MIKPPNVQCEPVTTGHRSTLIRLGVAGALVFLLAVGGAAAGMTAWVFSRGAPSAVPVPGLVHAPTARASGAAVPVEGALIAGSGVVLPILGRLAEVYNTKGSGTVRVAPSIGSGGGLAALGDGVIDCAVVSREVTAEEAGERRVIPFARSTVILAVGQDVPDRSLLLTNLLALYAGEEVRWADGRVAEVILREPGDSGTAVFQESVAGFEEAAAQGVASGRLHVALTDQEMQGALVSHTGAVGLFDPGIIRIHGLPLRALPLEGVPERSLGRGFALVLPPAPGEVTRRFAAFVCSSEGRKVLERYGYLPVPCGDPAETNHGR